MRRVLPSWRILLLLTVPAVLCTCRRAPQDARTIRFELAEQGYVSIVVKASDGRVVRRFPPDGPVTGGSHAILWDGRDDDARPLPAGDYEWSGVRHTGIRAQLRGWACAVGESPWSGTAAPGGVPSAVCAEGGLVYLGWNGGAPGPKIAACDLDGRLLWTAQLGAGGAPFQCEALAVDGGILFALGRQYEGERKTDALFRFDAATGHPRLWPKSSALPITSLWPGDASAAPSAADGMAVGAGRVYLSFAEAQFLAVLDARTGAYLQTVVGGAPRALSVTSTRSESPDRPGELMAADFALISLRGGLLGKVLFAHDPLWVMTSELEPLAPAEHVTALLLEGDGAKYFAHHFFAGFAPPFQQVQRRSVLESSDFLWSAGAPGGRSPRGPWNAGALGPIAALALDGRGQLWVAEAAAAPSRFSVWTTSGTQGQLAREIFTAAPPDRRGVAMLPGDPDTLIGMGCEWRLQPGAGPADCVGVIDTNPTTRFQFAATPEGGPLLQVTHADGSSSSYERKGAGDYQLMESAVAPAVKPSLGEAALPENRGTVRFAATDRGWDVLLGELRIATLFTSDASKVRWPARAEPGADLTLAARPDSGEVMQTRDGRVFAATQGEALWSVEITGLPNVRALQGGKLVVERAGP